MVFFLFGIGFYIGLSKQQHQSLVLYKALETMFIDMVSRAMYCIICLGNSLAVKQRGAAHTLGGVGGALVHHAGGERVPLLLGQNPATRQLRREDRLKIARYNDRHQLVDSNLL